jgi:FkbM family methyltransferase
MIVFIERMLFRFGKALTIARARELRRALFSHRVAAGIEHLSVLTQLEGCMAIVDIGANRGQFSLAARHVFPSAIIDAVEPLSRPAATFERVFSGDPRVRLHKVAIGPDSAEATMHISARDDSSSLLSITDRQRDQYPGTHETGTTSVRMTPLSELINPEQLARPALLKIDVQGFELEALKGCESLLDRFSWIYVECSFQELYERQPLADEVIDWLKARNLRLRGIYHLAYDSQGRALQGDFLFSR